MPAARVTIRTSRVKRIAYAVQLDTRAKMRICLQYPANPVQSRKLAANIATIVMHVVLETTRRKLDRPSAIAVRQATDAAEQTVSQFLVNPAHRKLRVTDVASATSAGIAVQAIIRTRVVKRRAKMVPLAIIVQQRPPVLFRVLPEPITIGGEGVHVILATRIVLEASLVQLVRLGRASNAKQSHASSTFSKYQSYNLFRTHLDRTPKT